MSDLDRLRVCPVKWFGGDGCQHPHEIFTARVVAPDGRQAAVFACVEHLPLEMAAALNGLRRDPPDMSVAAPLRVPPSGGASQDR